MLNQMSNQKMGSSNLGWLKSKFHFSFADYYNPKNMHFGVLRVLNDDLIQPGSGFDTHPHKDMEIISYIVSGSLTHADSMGNQHTLTRGQVQYMSAGTGVFHSEHNFGKETLRLLQMWIVPDQKGLKPNYGDYGFQEEDRKNQWLLLVSGKEKAAPIQVNQDVHIYALELDAGNEIAFPVRAGRQAYLVQIEGRTKVNDIPLEERDAMEIVEEDILLHAIDPSHILVIEMKKHD
jgi:quercetin 2,3-dioxygenase